MDLLATFRNANRAFFDSIFLPDFCDAREPIGAFRVAGLFTTSKYWLKESREYREQLAKYDVVVCGNVATYAVKCRDVVTCDRVCQCILARLVVCSEPLALRCLFNIIDVATDRNNADMCAVIMRTAVSRGPCNLTSMISYVFEIAISRDLPGIFECAMHFMKFLFHSRRVEEMIVSIYSLPTKCTRLAQAYQKTELAHAKVNASIIARVGAHA